MRSKLQKDCCSPVSRIILIFLLFSLVLTFSCKQPPHEHVESTFPDGSAQLVKFYKSEARENLVKEIHYYENGEKRMEGGYRNGERHGEWTAWYENGNVWSKGHYTLGKENGLKTVWHQNGIKYYEGEVVDDQRHGIWKFWNDKGELLKEVDYNK
jgi:uncharacterized protein